MNKRENLNFPTSINNDMEKEEDAQLFATLMGKQSKIKQVMRDETYQEKKSKDKGNIFSRRI